MRKIGMFTALTVMLALTGCIDVTTTVNLNEDGSGTIVDTSYMSAAAMGMMSGMTAGMSKDGVPPQTNPLMDKEKAEAKATKMGEGVKLASIKEITKPDGSKGAETIYSFSDINKLKVNMNQSNMDKNKSGAEGESTQKERVSFNYTKGLLTVNLPKPNPAEETEEHAPQDPQAEAMQMQMMQGMLHMFKGMRMRVMIKVPSQIKQTNAKHVSADPKTKKKQIVTLLDMNLDKLLEQPDGMKKLMELQKIKDEAKAMGYLSSVDGIKVETGQKVEIKF